MRILLLSDGIAGHYRQAEGIVAALGRSRAITVERLELSAPRLIPRKSLPHLARWVPPRLFLKLCGIDYSALAKPDLIISAGGATLGANAALARVLSVPNIFSGSARGLSPHRITLTLLPYPSAAHREGHLYALKPGTINPEDFPTPPPWQGLRNQHASLLIGGNTAHMRFTAEEWEKLVQFVALSIQSHGVRWHIVTSRRTPPEAYAAFEKLPPESRSAITWVDFRAQGAGSIQDAFAAGWIGVTGDSLSMISEAVAVNRRTLVLMPAQVTPFRDSEAIAQLENEKRLALLPVAQLSLETVEKSLETVTPGTSNHLDDLGQKLIHRLGL